MIDNIIFNLVRVREAVVRETYIGPSAINGHQVFGYAVMWSSLFGNKEASASDYYGMLDLLRNIRPQTVIVYKDSKSTRQFRGVEAIADSVEVRERPFLNNSSR